MDPFVVWAPASVIAASVAGLSVGTLLALFPALARSSRPQPGMGLRASIVAGLLLVWCGGAFYAGQWAEAFTSPESGIGERLVSRFLLWCLFSASVSVGAYLTLRARSEA